MPVVEEASKDAPQSAGYASIWTGLVRAVPTDLVNVSAISRARSGEAPLTNISPEVCDCGFMRFAPKNPYHCEPSPTPCPLPPPPPLPLFAPFDGTITELSDSKIDHVAYVRLRAQEDPRVDLLVVGIDTVEIANLSQVHAGEHIGRGYLALGLVWSGSSEPSIIPLPAAFSPDVAYDFAAEGWQAEDLVIPRGSATPHPLTCDPTEGRVGPSDPQDWVARASSDAS